MRGKLTLITCLLLIQFAAIFAQSKGGIIKGKIIDSQSGDPVAFASITINNPKDSTAVKGCASGVTGEFILAGIAPGKYFLKVSYIGYQKKFIPNVGISNDKSEINFGDIKLTQTAVQLEANEVTAQKPEEEFHIDKRVINVSQNLNSTSGTALDILKNNPSIQVDQNENVTLRGSSNFTVLINGRPGVMQGSDALKQIPANTIDNIEIITNPSAKYDAEGAAGIINIITKKLDDSSISGVANLGAGTRDKYNGDFTINYRQGNYSLSGGLDYLKNNTFITQSLTRETYYPGFTSFNNSDFDLRVIQENYTAKLGVDYNFSPNTGITINGSYGKVNTGRKISSYIQNIIPSLTVYSDTWDDYMLGAEFYSGAFYFTHKFTPNVNELNFEAVYNNVSSPSIQSTVQYLTDPTFQIKQDNPYTKLFTDDTKRYDGRFKLNYTQTFSPKSKFETGLQVNYYVRNFNTQNNVYDWTLNQWGVLPNYTDKFEYRNNIYAGFAQYSNEIFDIGFQLGLRYEYTDRVLDQTTMGSSYKFQKGDFFPTINLFKKLGVIQTIQFSYSRRINRPNELLLNPYPFFSDSYTSSSGNPYLLPEYINSFELNYQNFFSGTYLTVLTYLRSSNNTIYSSVKVDNTGKLNSTTDNIASTTFIGAEITASNSPFTWLTLRPSITLYNYNFQNNQAGQETDDNYFLWHANLFTTLMLGSNTSAQVILVYTGKQVQPQSVVKPLYFLIASVKQMFFNKKLTVTLSAQNLFNIADVNVTTTDVNFRNLMTMGLESNVIKLTFTWNFNNFQAEKKAVEKPDIGIKDGI